MRKELLKRREELKMTQEQVAEAAGISRPFYAQVESGQRNPAPEVKERIAMALKVKYRHEVKETDPTGLFNEEE